MFNPHKTTHQHESWQFPPGVMSTAPLGHGVCAWEAGWRLPHPRLAPVRRALPMGPAGEALAGTEQLFPQQHKERGSIGSK